MKKRLFLRIGLVLLLSAGLSAPGWAQAGRGKGRLAGTVKDADGRPIADVRILLEHTLGFKAETRSNAMGQWAIAGLGTGDVTILFLAEGFPPTTARAKVRQLSPNPPLPIVLKPLAGDRPAEGAGLPIPPADRRSVQLTLYMMIASPDALKTDFEHPTLAKDLERVMAELKTLLNFRSYTQAGTYPMTLREGDSRDVQLFAKPPLRCSIDEVRIAKDSEGREKVLFRLVLEQYNPLLNRFLKLIESRTEVFDQGHLVAGVSSFQNSNSLALIVGAEIK